MVCKVNKIDSNITALYIAEEVCLGQLPTIAVDGFDPVWYAREPNSYSDFGGENTLLARNPIDPSRQNKRGTISDLDASGGHNEDFTKSNFNRLLQGFFFADARRKFSTESFTLGTANTLLSSVTAADKKYNAASNLAGFNTVSALVYARGFSVAANNGLKTVTAADATGVTVSETLVNEATPPANAKLSIVGFQFASATAAISVSGGVVQLTSSSTNLTTLGLIVGEWVFIGGDLSTNRFTNNVGFARISAIASGALTFDDTTFTPVTEAGTGKTIRLFFGDVIKNEKLPALIKRRSYSIERQLGSGSAAENVGDPQAEYLEGSVANEFTLNIAQADKINADITFVSTDVSFRSGAVGSKIKGGTRVSALGETAFNTSSDVYRIKMNVLDPTTSVPAPLFAYVTDATIAINNGVEPMKAVGKLGAVDMTAGNFGVTGSVTAYFQSVTANVSIRNNYDAAFNVILASQNAGFIYDIPLMGLGGGRIAVEKDAAVTVPLENSAAENASGYTLLYNSFAYLPTLAMTNPNL